MSSFTQSIAAEIADNWPAFLFIATTSAFSVSFLRERRAETRMLKEMGAALQDGIRARFDRLENMVQHPTSPTAFPESAGTPASVLPETPR